MAGERLRPRRLFGDEQRGVGDVLLQGGILGREGDVEAAGDHADRARQRADMRRGVDAAGEPGDDRRALRREIVREAAGEAACRRRGVARADDRDRACVRQ